MVTTLPVSCADPVQCLATISAQMRVVKHSGQAVGAKALTELSGFAPPTLLHEAARLVTRQRFVNLVVTNVPGPQFPLYLDGRELTDMFPIVPLGANLNLGVADRLLQRDAGLRPRRRLRRCCTTSRTWPTTSSPPCWSSRPLRRGVHRRRTAAPWPGYDQQTVPVIAKRLHDAGEDVAAAVRSYELEHKHRRGVIDATERPHRSCWSGDASRSADRRWRLPRAQCRYQGRGPQRRSRARRHLRRIP